MRLWQGDVPAGSKAVNHCLLCALPPCWLAAHVQGMSSPEDVEKLYTPEMLKEFAAKRKDEIEVSIWGPLWSAGCPATLAGDLKHAGMFAWTMSMHVSKND